MIRFAVTVVSLAATVETIALASSTLIRSIHGFVASAAVTVLFAVLVVCSAIPGA